MSESKNKSKSGTSSLKKEKEYGLKPFTFEKEGADPQHADESVTDEENKNNYQSLPSIEFEQKPKQAKAVTEEKVEVASTEKNKEKKQKTQGQGERVLEFNFEEEAKPVLKLYFSGNKEYIFEIGDKLSVGSDPKKSKVHLNMPGIEAVHLVIGIKGEEVLLKHNDVKGATLRGKVLEIGKTYKLPYGVKFKIGDFHGEVLRSLPLGLEEAKLNKNWKIELSNDIEEFKPKENYKAQDEKKKKKSLLGKLFSLFLDPRDGEEQKEDEDDDDDSTKDWVTEEEWEKAEEADKPNLKVIKPGEIFEKNFKKEDKEKIKKAPFFLRPFYNFFHSLKDELSVFETKKRKDFDKQLNYSKEKLVDKYIENLTQSDLITPEQAEKLIKNGVTNIKQVANLDNKQLAKIIKLSPSEAEEVAQSIEEKSKTGEIKALPKTVMTLEKQIAASESRADFQSTRLMTAGPFKRILGAFYNFLFIYGLYSLLQEKQLLEQMNGVVVPHLKTAVGQLEQLAQNTLDQNSTLQYWLTTQLKATDVKVAFLHYGVFHLAVQTVAHLLFGTNAIQFILGLRNNRSFVASRLLGVVRYYIGLVTAPFLVFDLPILFRMKSFKELVTFNTLVRRRPYPVAFEFGTMLIATGLCLAGFMQMSKDGYLQKAYVYSHKIKEKVVDLNWDLIAKPAQLLQQLLEIEKVEKIITYFEAANAEVIVNGGALEEGGQVRNRSIVELRQGEISFLLGNDKIQFTAPVKFQLIHDLENKRFPILLLHSGQLILHAAAESKTHILGSKVILLPAESGTYRYSINQQESSQVLLSLKGSLFYNLKSFLNPAELSQKEDEKIYAMIPALEGGNYAILKRGCFLHQFRKSPFSPMVALAPLQWLAMHTQEERAQIFASLEEGERFCTVSEDTEGKIALEDGIIYPKSGAFVNFGQAFFFNPGLTANFDSRFNAFIQESDLVQFDFATLSNLNAELGPFYWDTNSSKIQSTGNNLFGNELLPTIEEANSFYQEIFKN